MSLTSLTNRQKLEQELRRTRMLLDVMGRMHVMLLKHLETSGKMSAEEYEAWEKDEMVPAFDALGITVTRPARPAAPPSNLVGMDGQPIASH
jgi:hypothetical protein